MSEEEKSAPEFPNPMKMFGDMFNQTVKQAGEQWEETARNPLFLAAMANQAEQAMQAQKQMKELFSSSLKSLDLPTKADLLLISERLDALTRAVADLDKKVSDLSASTKKQKK